MTGEDIFRALSEIDDELLIRPSRTALTVRKGRKRKKFALILVAAMSLLLLCAFGYASRLDITYEDGVVEISVYNPNAVDEYEQWSMAYLADGYEIIQVADFTWLVTNGSQGFYLTQMDLDVNASGTVKTAADDIISEIQMLESVTALTTEYVKSTKTFFWKSNNCAYSATIFGENGEDNEIVAMIQSITP